MRLVAVSQVSVLFNEPKLLKFRQQTQSVVFRRSFSALQRAEIAEIQEAHKMQTYKICFSALQRAEIAEIHTLVIVVVRTPRFSALQRAEIAEMYVCYYLDNWTAQVSVLFNEPKLLKSSPAVPRRSRRRGFSALQRAEIAEICVGAGVAEHQRQFQCSSTSRNC